MSTGPSDTGAAVAAAATTVAGDASPSYIIQLFSDFAPPDSNPLLLRLDVNATFRDVVVRAIAKFQERHPVGIFLPSLEAAEFACYVAAGDGFPDVRHPQPLDPAHVVRSANLKFPFMISLVYEPTHTDSAAGAEGVGASEDAQDRSGAAVGPVDGGNATRRRLAAQVQRAKTLSQQEKEDAAKRRAEIEARREENLRRIERERLARERTHFQHCESYEVLRREEAIKRERERAEEEKMAELKRAAEELRSEVASEKAAAQEFTLLERHRDEMNARVEEDRALRRAMQEQRERKLAEARMAAEEARRKQRAAQEAVREQRMKQSMAELLADLDRKCLGDLECETTRLERERAQRQGAEQAAIELRRVAQLEEQLQYSRMSERRQRFNKCDASVAEEHRARQLAVEARELEALREAEEYGSWNAARQQAIEGFKSELELRLRGADDQSRRWAAGSAVGQQ